MVENSRQVKDDEPMVRVEKSMIADAVDHCYALEEAMRKIVELLGYVWIQAEEESMDTREAGKTACLYVTKEYLNLVYERDMVYLLELLETTDKLEPAQRQAE